MKLKAGTHKVDISPKRGIELAGYPHYPRHNTGINDPLYATCLYLDNGQERIIMISLDLLFYSKKYQKTVKERICEEIGVLADNILITCTHTHSGPWASGRLDLEALEKEMKPDEDYLRKLEESLVLVSKEAKETTFLASIGSNKGYCGKEEGVGGNRRDPEGISDPDVLVMGIKDIEGELRACIVNYALHPTFLHADNTLVSADYPGYIRKCVEESYPRANMLFFQGCSGDQSSRYFRRGQSFKEAKRVGEVIGKSALLALDKINYSNQAHIESRYDDIDIILRTLPDKVSAVDAVKKAEASYNELKAKDAKYIDIQNANVRLLGAEDILGYIIMNEQNKRIDLYEDEKPARIQVLKISEAIIAAMPGEIFAQYGRKIKDRYPDIDIIVSAVSNGCLPGYVYTKEAYNEGGYEVDTSLLSFEMGEKMTDKVFELIQIGGF